MQETSHTAPSEPALAATAVLLRDGVSGLEVLLLERPSDRGSFAGAWVFPGGRVDPEDWVAGGSPGIGGVADATAVTANETEQNAARRAAVREVREETGLAVAPGELATTACWTPPASAPRRFRTWFFIAPAPEGELLLPPDEVVDHAWVRPAAALGLHGSGALLLVPPTWVTLHGLSRHDTVNAALAEARRAPVQEFATRMGAAGTILLWEGDVAYDDDTLVDTAGARHRLEVGRLPWAYRRYPEP
ncbi:NUDIX hydrolase [Glaciibacter sp. 2TAF33]|uniref:NUDIX hydrolase n=1 Tax=Glaciibacter sp. 2TAF33 TaxID=3233015 RepID=UPI003F92AFD2